MGTEGMWGFKEVINGHRGNVGVYGSHHWAQRECGGLKRSSMDTEGIWGFMGSSIGAEGNLFLFFIVSSTCSEVSVGVHMCHQLAHCVVYQ